MLRRAPTIDGKVVGLHESTRVNKPFKPPTPLVLVDRTQLQRKRKRVSYKGQQAEESDSDDENGRKKKKKKDDRDKDGNYHNEAELIAAIKKYPVYKPKPFETVGSRSFTMPSMKNKEGQIIRHFPSNISLGIRPQAKLMPRPLHDPMEGHAIVLYDPTIDDRETDEEKKEREKEEAKEKAANEAREKTTGMFNPHRSLRDMLGEGKDKKKQVDKVAVVIDPRLTKVLRPHQVEGVKVGGTPSISLTLLTFAVLVQMHHRNACRQPVWLHHGG
jgi:DNA repair and recombination RAD54-like protein